VALQARLVETLRSRGMTEPDGPLSEQDAGHLADHLADDTFAMFDLTPRRPGVGSLAARPSRGWLKRPRSRNG
jgi:hypothetical protein